MTLTKNRNFATTKRHLKQNEPQCHIFSLLCFSSVLELYIVFFLAFAEIQTNSSRENHEKILP